MLNLNPPFLLFFWIKGMPFPQSFPPKSDIILLGGAEAPPAPMVETPMNDYNHNQHFNGF